MCRVRQTGRRALLDTFRWEGGHADIWRVLADGHALAAVVADLVKPWTGEAVTAVVGIESRGFVLGGAAAVRLGVGFVAVRKAAGLLPGPKVETRTGPDYRNRRHLLRMQSVLSTGDRVLLVDDWAERGAQARGARQLVEACGATFLGTALLVDQMTTGSRSQLGRVTALVHASELGTDGR